MNRKKIIMNADDAGMHRAIDRAIVELAGKKRISSASLMALAPGAADAAADLHAADIDVGLHLDFTSDFANRQYKTSRTVRSLIAEAWSGRLDTAHAYQVVHDQLDRFETVAGKPPRFVDGHEHVHQFPRIREALLGALRERYPGQHFFIRNTSAHGWHGGKAAVIAVLGGRRLRTLAGHAGYACNTDFRGVYDFGAKSNLQNLWRRWLSSLPQRGGLVMCHPALQAIGGDIDAARTNEFRFLASTEFADLMSECSVEVAGWSEALSFDASEDGLDGR